VKQKSPPNILEFYKRESEAATKTASAQTTERFAYMQTGGPRIKIADPVRVKVPAKMDVTAVIGAAGLSHNVAIEYAQRVVWISRDDAVAMLTSGTADVSPWCEANRELAADLRANKPPAPASTRWADLMADQPRSPFDKGGICADTFAMLGMRR
jgi:hypothetical protein